MLTFRTNDRDEWRSCLEHHHQTAYDIWFVFPAEGCDEESLSHDDVVDEALCFGWAEDTSKVLDSIHRMSRFLRRPADSPYSPDEVERLGELASQGRLSPAVHEGVASLVGVPFVSPVGTSGDGVDSDERVPAAQSPRTLMRARSSCDDPKASRRRRGRTSRSLPDGLGIRLRNVLRRAGG